MTRYKWRILWLAYNANRQAANIWPEYSRSFRKQMSTYKSLDILANYDSGGGYKYTREIRNILESICGRSPNYRKINHIFK